MISTQALDIMDACAFLWKYSPYPKPADNFDRFYANIHRLAEYGIMHEKMMDETGEVVETAIFVPTRNGELDAFSLIPDQDGMYVYCPILVRHPKMRTKMQIMYNYYIQRVQKTYPRAEYLYWEQRFQDGQYFMVRISDGD
jgi:hypothetical protein